MSMEAFAHGTEERAPLPPPEKKAANKRTACKAIRFWK